MESKRVRELFFDFFQNKGHQLVASAPIVLKEDPTLMFTNSGMNQFKDFFLGYKKPEELRLVDSQKCLRVSGKHNDLDDVGRDTYHHTMFEMLGNWSFGDYFKEEAISWAWELLTEVYKIPEENLYVTVFEGDEKEKLEKDSESEEFWKKYISEDRILLGNKKDNFWEMGATGPCGPCSEIHIDIRSTEEKQKVDGRTLVNMDHPQVVEVWNLVFMQYLRKADSSLEKLAAKSIDTGMGFERLCMALQGKTSNYDTDVFSPLIEKLEQVTGFKYNTTTEVDMAIRVVVDHIRAVAFAIADGQLPSNNGAGYVIRRILRRAISYGYRFLGQKEAFMYQLLPVLNAQMKDFFPEIEKQKTIIEGVIKEEEISFLRTIQQGLSRIEQIMEAEEGKQIAGAKVFELYDTFGFPADLSRIIAEEKGMSIDEAGFEFEMKKQKQRSKASAETQMDDWVVLEEGAKEDFIGYDQTEAKVKITRYRKVKVKKGSFYQLVFNSTPFYAESGGQVGDTGYLSLGEEKVSITDTKKENNLMVHFSKDLPKQLDATYAAKVDVRKRTETIKNHSATHLLHEALREVLGRHVEQKGSYVDHKYLRFDFSHFAKLTEVELAKVELLVNQKIQAALVLQENRSATFDEAVAQGAMALFGEKYGKVVRTIQFGTSVELCGGCHVENTAQIQLFKLSSESSTAAGIRRIEAFTGEKARRVLMETESQFLEINDLLKKPKDAVKSVADLLKENSQLKKQLEQFQKEKAKGELIAWKEAVTEINGVNFLSVSTELDAGQVKSMAFQMKKEIQNLFLVAGSKANQKPSLTVVISDNLVEDKNLNAGTIVRELAKEINGGGGGQAFFATAGGSKLEGLQVALDKAKSYID